MPHKNYRRPPKFRKPVSMKPNKVIIPESVYDREKDKRQIKKLIREYTNG